MPSDDMMAFEVRKQGHQFEIMRKILRWAWQGNQTATQVTLQLRTFVASDSMQMGAEFSKLG